MSIQELQRRIGYEFQSDLHLTNALTHPSCNIGQDYERLEFLGDAVIELVVSELLFQEYQDFAEGALTQKRAEIVCSRTLAQVARSIGLGDFLLLGKGEEQSGGRDKQSILENAMEAVMGAVFLDGGFYAAQSVARNLFHNTIKRVMNSAKDSDYKTYLQELVQRTIKKDINYLLSRKEGPAHNMTFYVKLILGDDVVAEGVGNSKKQAEQNAAKYAVEHFDSVY